MTVIHLSSCDRCKPEKWKAGAETVGAYWCIKCRKSVTKVMERKETRK